MGIIALVKKWSLLVSLCFGIAVYCLFASVPLLQPIGDVAGPFAVSLLPIVLFLLLYVTFCKIQIEDRILEFFVMDYRQENQARLAVGDKITVWGEVAGELEGNTSHNGISIKLPSIYARFIDLQ